MNILLDENLPLKLVQEFPGKYLVKTVKSLGWQGLKNGALLKKAIKYPFDVFITMDKNIRHQQNLKIYDIKIILLFAVDNTYESLTPLADKVIKHLNSGLRKKITEIS